jgi:hypothetical protein
MKMTIDLPEALIKQVKLRALHEGKKLKDAVAEILKKGLAVASGGRNGKSSRHNKVVIRKDPKTGLPVIQSPADAPVRRMTAEQILAMEERSQVREDLERIGISI